MFELKLWSQVCPSVEVLFRTGLWYFGGIVLWAKGTVVGTKRCAASSVTVVMAFDLSRLLVGLRTKQGAKVSGTLSPFLPHPSNKNPFAVT